MPTAPKSLADEKDIQKQCEELIRVRGGYCLKIHSGNVVVMKGPARCRMMLAPRGTPDIFACYQGRFLAIEMKKSPEEVAEWERHWQAYLASGTDKKGRVIKPAWERSVYQHMEQELMAKSGVEVLICSSVEELDADLNTLAEQYNREAAILASSPTLP